MSNPLAIARLEARGSRLIVADYHAKAAACVTSDISKAAHYYRMAAEYRARAATVEMLLANA